jgi:heme oxygenase
MNQNLAQRLREGTATSHTMAENTAFMKCFLKGVVEKEPFRQLLANLYFVYSALEEALRQHQEHPVVGKIYFAQLNRKDSLEQDLAFYFGEDWNTQIQPSPAGQAYVERIKELADQEPVRLIGHAYTRYLGDLSGGQGLKKVVRSALELPADVGTAFYEFAALPTMPEIMAFKGLYRQALDDLVVTEAEINAIVEEANAAFTMNRDVMHDLEADVKAAIGEERFISLTCEPTAGSTEQPHPVA